MARYEHMVEELFESYLSIRIVKALALSQAPVTKYLLVKNCGINTRTANKILNTLTKYQWVKKTTYKPVKYNLNMENPTVRKLLEFLTQTGYI